MPLINVAPFDLDGGCLVRRLGRCWLWQYGSKKGKALGCGGICITTRFVMDKEKGERWE